MNIIINADDFANSMAMSETICRCFDEGMLTSTSMMINTPYVEDAFEKIRQRPSLRVSLHLNIAEGKPLADTKEIAYLVDEKGFFCKRYETILTHYYFGNVMQKKIIKSAIKAEYAAQITRYATLLGTETIHLDSHQHYHTIPFISDILIELSQELPYQITYVRVPKEPFFLELSSFRDLKNYCGLNIIKHFLLNLFSHQLARKLKAHHITCNTSFIGVLFTGNMTLASIQKALQKCHQEDLIEILLHPGFLAEAEATKWSESPFKTFYTHPHRKEEMEILLSPIFKTFIQSIAGNHYAKHI
ncbi:ChbG/HpnK family deacetylase [Sulfurospirillum diekertiae]|uniref:ChbG/HpnK family deacetylase n=1 Tax=Sulfurospirillum diekertiae TaxID=1854492 RepID=A0A6G9VSB7_9BACT|nr:ChbG/HpnK family deacetylase [Sulfurospirillum diekertiae]QIR75864.1 ChbG/HpnK family deacetylase [Sulfurospirillum diekertiae]QIR78503.1 ChbG/HpnK family deacetylase [Sulfurospirillum diekertiae]